MGVIFMLALHAAWMIHLTISEYMCCCDVVQSCGTVLFCDVGP